MELWKAWQREGIRDPLERMEVQWIFIRELEQAGLNPKDYCPYPIRLMQIGAFGWVDHRVMELSKESKYWNSTDPWALTKMIRGALQACTSYQWARRPELGKKADQLLRVEIPQGKIRIPPVPTDIDFTDIYYEALSTDIYYEVLSPNGKWNKGDYPQRIRWMEAITRWSRVSHG